MNCKQAREILNSMLDGEGHPRIGDAREHMRLCAECREWLAGTERMVQIVESHGAGVFAPDIAASVMARLPDRHPAGVRSRRRAWNWKRGFVWVGASWLVGLLAVAAIGFAVCHWLTGPTVGEYVVAVYGFMRAVQPIAGSIIGAFRPVLQVSHDLLSGVAPYAVTTGLVFLALDSALLIAAYLIWRRKWRIPGTMCVLV
jgi:predicted anti-sigma-YlaC factor YlaD